MRLLPLLLAATMTTAPVLLQGQTFQDGLDAYIAGDYETAAEIFFPFAEEGDAGAQFNLALMYDDGRGVPQDDAEAVKWYRLAAEQGNARAQYNLGVMYANGEGVPQDYAEAVEWYRMAAEQGHTRAQFNLALKYYKGEGVPQYYAEAAKWFRLAAEQGKPQAQNYLGAMYYKGDGVPQNYINAYILFNLAAAKGIEDSRLRSYWVRRWSVNRDMAAEELTPDQLAEGQRLSSEWELGEPLPLQGG